MSARAPSDLPATRGYRVLVHHRATGYVHRSIPDAVEALVALGAAHDIAVDVTDDPARFTSDALARCAVVVFVHTSGDVLPEPSQRDALQAYVEGGGGWVGVHAASSIDDDVADAWPWYRHLVGARFTGHTVARLWCDADLGSGPGHVHAGPFADAPADAEPVGPGVAMTSWEPATVHVEDPASPTIVGIVDGDVRADEWYGFDENPRPRVQVVATVDEATYEPAAGTMGTDHPIVWWHRVGRGLAVYNAMGHSAATWRDPTFLSGLLGALDLAAGRVAP